MTAFPPPLPSGDDPQPHDRLEPAHPAGRRVLPHDRPAPCRPCRCASCTRMRQDEAEQD